MRLTDYQGYFYLTVFFAGIVVCEEEYCHAQDASCNFDQIRDKLRTKLVVAAIDFGTTYSGWAYQTRKDYFKDKSNIQTSKWFHNDILSKKTPTTVLIQPDGETLEAFGYEAETRYLELAAEEEHRQYYYFKRFKMMLYDIKDLHKGTKLVDDKGLELPAITVFSSAIRFLKEHLMGQLKNMDDNFSVGDVYWVLTVPAIWNDKAKSFMRMSAVVAGIENEDLTIALEPEAASLYCRLVQGQRQEDSQGNAFVENFQPGRRYMILDAGGGTIDITVHQVMTKQTLRELHRASGGPWGGTKVDEAFFDMIKAIIGEDMYTLFKEKCAQDHLELLRSFERIKRTISPDKIAKISFHFPQCLDILLKEQIGKAIQELISVSPYKHDIKLKFDKFIISADVGRSFFTVVVENVIKAVKTLLTKDSIEGTDTLLMVGGFSDSQMLQDAIRAAFKGVLHVFTPQNAEMAIVKGAVNYGYFPGAIIERVTKYTYGIRTVTQFVEGLHDQSKRFRHEGRDLCSDVFHRHVKIETPIKFGTVQGSHTYFPIYEEHDKINVIVVACSSEQPLYSTDHGCSNVGRAEIEVTDRTVPRLERRFVVEFTFSDTEIKVTTTEQRTGKQRDLYLSLV